MPSIENGFSTHKACPREEGFREGIQYTAQRPELVRLLFFVVLRFWFVGMLCLERAHRHTTHSVLKEKSERI